MAGVCTVVGLAILIYRRRTVGPVFSATTRMDKTMYVFLSAVILLGLWNTVASNIFGHYDYRDGVSVWFRGIFRFDLHPELMAQAPLGFQIHGMLAMLCSRCGRSPGSCTCSARRRLPLAAVRGLPQPRVAHRFPRPAARVGAGGQHPPLIGPDATRLLPQQQRRSCRTGREAVIDPTVTRVLLWQH